MSNPSIAFVGAGNMAASLIGGLRAQGVAASAIRASEPGDEQRARLQQEHGIATFADNAEAIKGADLIVAINTDPDAKIFEFAHLGVVADALTVLPALSDAFARRLRAPALAS
ncbi:MAG: pyrroline-5-carboxylate reductase [Pseudomonas sp. 63_8]|nr:MAG: pyrroline-5-carboxylate reductase [Pseudomonas sp. 63_8]